MKISSGAVLAIALASAFATVHAQVTTLNPGEHAYPVNVLDPIPKIYQFNDPAVLVSTTTAFDIPNEFRATLRTAVIDGPEPGVNLDFYYQLYNHPIRTSTLPVVTTIAVLDIGSAPIGVAQTQSWVINASSDPSTVPNAIDLFADKSFLIAGYANGDLSSTIYQYFDCCWEPRQGKGSELYTNESTYTLIVRTTAQFYASGFFKAHYSGTSAEVSGDALIPTFRPAIPEPSTNALIVAGLGLMGFVVRRRMKRTSA